MLVPFEQSCRRSRLHGAADIRHAMHVLGNWNGRSIEIVMDDVICRGALHLAIQGYIVVGHGERSAHNCNRLALLMIPSRDGVALRRDQRRNRHRITGGILGMIHRQRRAKAIGNRAVERIRHRIELLPHRVQIVLLNLVNASLFARREFGSSRARLGAPAEEAIAIARRKPRRLIAQKRHKAVVRSLYICMGLIRIEIGMIGHLDHCVGVAILRVKRHVGGRHPQLIVGVVVVAIAVRPVEEDLARRRGRVRGEELHVGIAILRISLSVHRRSAGTLTQVIGNAKACGAGVVRVQLYIAIDNGVKVEGDIGIVTLRTRAHTPTVPGEALRNVRLQAVKRSLVQLGAVGDINRLRIAAGIHGQVNHTMQRFRLPLGVNGDILRGHSAAKGIRLAETRFIAVPTLELVIFIIFIRAIWFVAYIIDALFEKLRNRILFFALVDKSDVIRVSIVIELGLRIVITLRCTKCGIQRIACNIIPVFTSNT